MSLHKIVFVGSYAEAEASGVRMYSFDEQEGTLSLLDEVKGLKNPTFLNVDVPNHKLYAIAEGVSEDGGKMGEAVAYAIELNEGKGELRELNRKAAITASACHIQRDANNRYVLL